MKKNRIKPIVPHYIIKLKAKVEAAKSILKEFTKELDKAKEDIKVACTSDVYGTGCGNQQRIGDTIYLQTTYKAYECGVGDRWYNGEGQFKCNKCGKITRLYDCEEITLLQNNFKDVEYKEDR